MRILSISYEYPPLGGGGAKVVAGLNRELAEQGFDIDMVTMWYPGLRLFEREGRLRIFRIPCIRFNRSVCRIWEMPLYLLFAFPVLLFLCLFRRYDINHTHFIFPDGVSAYLLKKIFGLPYVITAHGSDVPGYNPDRFVQAHRFLAPLWRRLVASANCIICPSRSLQGLVNKQHPGARFALIPNGIDTHILSPGKQKRKDILVVSRLFERKGVQYVIDALVDLQREYNVNIVGDGPYLEALKERARQRNVDVTFWGHLDNRSAQFIDLYESASIFVFTSESENFPIVLLEAMAAGLAIITTRGTGCAEVVGDCALTVRPKDPNAIRSALERLMDSPATINQLGLAARQRLDDCFSWSTVAQRYAELYREIAPRG